ncbi:hypothetical protein CERZMDRAFT_102742 [Cercospora zeae-maydis SCOH1-5]|uniref:Uncharacterized protein n=1 Tax=Cercospora zeae-maydis SCOH1-5 TaxID=717836 RepID=A0A6A6F158_9PEZI|nr:hypothetical protein CERZMDRAFT_102742 [Cercospora zeae-maydis SCOH1-5]
MSSRPSANHSDHLPGTASCAIKTTLAAITGLFDAPSITRSVINAGVGVMGHSNTAAKSTALANTAKTTVAALRHTEVFKNRAVYVRNAIISQSQLPTAPDCRKDNKTWCAILNEEVCPANTEKNVSELWAQLEPSVAVTQH